MVAVIELGYLGIGVSNLNDWRTFGTEVLGLEIVESSNENEFFFRMDYQHHRIIVKEDPSDDLLFLGYRVADHDAFLEIQAQLQSAGVPFTPGTDAEANERHVLELIKLVDPAGIPIEVFSSPHMVYSQPFHPGRPMHGKFKTDTGGLGHTFINGTYEASFPFYYALGMRGGLEYKVPLPDGTSTGIYFMHCSDRQHTVAFGVPQRKRINHLMLEVTDLDDVGLIHSLVRTDGRPVTITLGKHSNDQMFSFYFRNPSGWAIEYGWGGRRPPVGSEYYGEDLYGHDDEDGGFGSVADGDAV